MSKVNTLPWHQALINQISYQINYQRLPHALILRERDGFYDEQVIDRIAKLILCDTQTGDDSCQHCHLSNEQSHPNQIYLNAAEKVSINDIRQLEQQVWKTAIFDKPKVITIRCIDSLSLGAQNALLKTLEEPPPQTHFILSMQHKSAVLATIISRAQYIKHDKIENSEILHWLQQACQQQNKALSEVEIAKLAKLSHYNPANTLSLLLSEEVLSDIEADKKLFARYLVGKISGLQFADSLVKQDIELLGVRYIAYINNIIFDLFEKNAKQSDKSSEISIEYSHWNGLSQRQLFDLRDTLQEILKLNNTNVNMSLQVKQLLTDWQHGTRKEYN